MHGIPSTRPAMTRACRLLHTSRSAKPFSPNLLPFARPTPFNQRLQELTAFRRTYNHDTHNFSSKSARSALWTILLLNTGVFATWQYASSTRDNRLLNFLYDNFTLSEGNLAAGRYYTMVTMAFSHKDALHYFFNMFMLYTFGSILARFRHFGARHVYFLSLTSSVASSAAWLAHKRGQPPPPPPQRQENRSRSPLSLFSNTPQVRIQTIDAALGASGTVMATASLAACLMPLSPMLLMGVVPMPLFVTVGLYAALDLYMLQGERQSLVGHSAHLGGFAWGIAYYLLLLRKKGGVWKLLSRK